MTERPTKAVITAELIALAAAFLAAVLLAPEADWDPALLGLLVVLSVVSDLRAIETPVRKVKISGSLLAIVTGVVLLGSAPGALIGATTILLGWWRQRYADTDLLFNLVLYAWFPLITGRAFHLTVDGLFAPGDVTFYLMVLAFFGSALAMNLIGVASYSAYLDRAKLTVHLRRWVLPILPSELAAGLLTIGVTYAHHGVGLSAVFLFAAVLLTFQYLVGELLLSQDRAEELEVRARQLAGFQVALLSALLRTLDLRDRMTARHSAAVARYSGELAAAAGLSEVEQELAHSAGLLHDIGKFVLPDEILRPRTGLTESDWEQIRRHPEEGARIVSEIDGYAPISEIILAHHERWDGLGYPNGLEGEEIPLLARVVAVADSYDVMTARDSYREARSSSEAITELRRVAGTQLDGELVEAFVGLLAEKPMEYRRGEDADFETELAMDRRINDYVAATAPERAGSRSKNDK